MKKSFRFIPELWLRNRDLRACSPAARGFWVDLLALMHPSGYLTLANGRPMSDDQIAGLVGSPVRQVRAWLAELGEAGIFNVSQDNKLYSSRMVKEAAFSDRAKAAGEIGQVRKKAKALNHRPVAALAAGAAVATVSVVDAPRAAPAPSAPSPPAVAGKKPLDWWKSKAGWVRKGNEQALSMKPGEEFEDFQIRLAARIPMGRHLDVLTPGQVRAVESMMPKGPEAKKESA